MSYHWLNAPGIYADEGSPYPINVSQFPMTPPSIPPPGQSLNFHVAAVNQSISMNDSAYKLHESGDGGASLAEFIKVWKTLLESKLIKFQDENFGEFDMWKGSAADACVENFQHVQLPFLQQMIYAVATMVDQATHLHDAVQKAQSDHPQRGDIEKDLAGPWVDDQVAATCNLTVPGSAGYQMTTMTAGAHSHGPHGHRSALLAEQDDPWAADHAAWQTFYEESTSGSNKANLPWALISTWQEKATEAVTCLTDAAKQVPPYTKGTYDPMKPPSDGTYTYNGTSYDYVSYWDTSDISFSSTTWSYSDDVYLGIPAIDVPPVTPGPTPPPEPVTPGGISSLLGVLGKPGAASKVAEASQMSGAPDEAIDAAAEAMDPAAWADDAAAMADDSLGSGMLPASFDGGGASDMALQPPSTGDSVPGRGGAAAGSAVGPGRGIPNLAGAMGGAPGGGMGGGMPMGGGGAPGNQGGKAKRTNEEDKALYEEEREWTHGVIGVAPRPTNKQ
jgi:hypothetical protein